MKNYFKLIVSLLLVTTFVFVSFATFTGIANAAISSEADAYVKQYVDSGLKSFFSGKYNTRSGHDSSAVSWEDLVGSGSISVKKDEKNYFTNDGYKMNGTQANFGSDVLSVVNGKAFTVEILFGDFTSIGSNFNTFMNSSNDNFALFRRNVTDVIEFKCYGNGAADRVTVNDGLSLLPNSLITITCKVGDSVKIYINGHFAGTKAYTKTMGANDLFIGHTSPDKLFDAEYKSIRFYDRDLTLAEVEKNAKADNVFDKETLLVTATNIAQPVTNVAGDIAAVRKIDSSSELDVVAGASKKPAAVILKLNSKLDVVDDKGGRIASLDDAMKKLDNKIMAVFAVRDDATLTALEKYIAQKKCYDSFFMSESEALVLKARTDMPKVRGIIDYTLKYSGKNELSKDDCTEIRKSMHKNMGTIAYLPAEVASKEAIETLYGGITNVWIKGKDAPNTTEIFEYILSGAFGVVTDNTDAFLNVACNQIPANTMTRMPLNIGHRGIPSLRPENTIESYRYAIESGANVIETDIHVTTDNKLVIMHDDTTGRVCNKDVVVEKCSLAELEALYVNKGWEGNASFNRLKVPTFEELLKLVKGKDCKIFVEIKTHNANCVPLMKSLIDKYDMYDQISVITFFEDQIVNMRKYYPEMSVGFLLGSLIDETDSDYDMLQVMNTIGKYNTTLNPNNAGYGKNALRAANIRGISIYPWTFTDSTAYSKFFTLGYQGLTGNNANVQGAYVKELSYTESSGIFNVTAKTYNGSEMNVNSSVSFKFTDGAANASVSGNKVTVKEGTTSTFIIAYTANAGSKTYTVCTQPITLGTSSQNTEAPLPSGSGKTVSPTETETPSESDNPEQTAIPGESALPGETDIPGKTDLPTETGLPGETGKTTETELPSETSGQNVTEAPKPTGKPQNEEKAKGSALPIIIISACVLIVAGAITAFLIVRSKKK